MNSSEALRNAIDSFHRQFVKVTSTTKKVKDFRPEEDNIDDRLEDLGLTFTDNWQRIFGKKAK